MSQKVVCDRCGRVLSVDENPKKLAVTYDEVGRANMDICFKCDDPVINLIDRLLLTKPKPKGKAPVKRPKAKPTPMVPADLPDPHPHFRD